MQPYTGRRRLLSDRPLPFERQRSSDAVAIPSDYERYRCADSRAPPFASSIIRDTFEQRHLAGNSVSRTQSPPQPLTVTKNNESRDQVDMAHCQLRGPLIGPLRERRRAELAGQHPVWGAAREFQSTMMTISQSIRRTPGISGNVANEICAALTSQCQSMNNAIRETVDDVSEIRLQIDEANQAIMGLKLQGTANKHDLGEMEKQIKEQVQKTEDVENRFAKYHIEAEKDRNEIREHIVQLKLAEDAETKQVLMGELVEKLDQQLSVSHDIYAEPEKVLTEYDKALAAVKKANPGMIPDSPEKPAKTINGNVATSFGSPIPLNGQYRFLGGPQESLARQDSASAIKALPAPVWAGPVPGAHSNGGDSDPFRTTTPQQQANGFQHPAGPGVATHDSQNGNVDHGDYSGSALLIATHGRPSTGLGQRNNEDAGLQSGPSPLSASHPASYELRPKAPEFRPSDPAFKIGNKSLENPSSEGARPPIDQISNTTYGQQRIQKHGGHGGHGRGRSHSRSRPSTAQSLGPQISHGGQHGGSFNGGFNPTVNSAAPRRPQYGPNHYDNRVVVARSQPAIPLGQVYGGIDDDLTRFREGFSELFGMSRSFVAGWVAQDEDCINRDAPVMQYLPKCYTGFTEAQAWSYVRQHMTDGLTRSCLFARVVVDFMVQRILVPTAWQGFNFQTDQRIQHLCAQLSNGPLITGSARTAHCIAVSEVVSSILNSERYENYRASRIDYFATELNNMFGPLMSRFADHEQSDRDLRAMVGKAWSLSAKTLASRLTFEFRFPEAGSRFSIQSMVAVAPNIDGFVLQAEHWRVQLVVTPVITVRNDNGGTLSVHVTNLAETVLMR